MRSGPSERLSGTSQKLAGDCGVDSDKRGLKNERATPAATTFSRTLESIE
jgi:hypothetical protein